MWPNTTPPLIIEGNAYGNEGLPGTSLSRVTQTERAPVRRPDPNPSGAEAIGASYRRTKSPSGPASYTP
jgi:hypothetical protein